jgi:hypothetical protein
MSFNSAHFDPKYVTRRGAGGRKYKVVETRCIDRIYILESSFESSFVVPMDDYVPCAPPEDDVSTLLKVVDGYVEYNGEKIARLCCNRKYTISFNPFKVIRVRD